MDWEERLMIDSDPYQLLGVPRHATDAEVASAYTRLTTVFDPHRWEAPPARWHEAQAWTNTVNEARQAVLASSDRLTCR